MKKIFGVLGLLILGSLLWYLAIKPYDYLVSLEVKASPGTINQSIKLWNSALENAEITDQEGLELLTQRLQFGDSIHLYRWEIKPKNDSLSVIKVFIKDQEHSLANKISTPFSDTAFEKRSRKNLLAFNDDLKDHLSSFKVRIAEQAESPEAFCACTTRKTTQFGKAAGMMADHPLLSSLLAAAGIQLNGAPMLEVTSWNTEKDRLEFNFCFPIVKTDSLPAHPELTYKKITAKPSLKAIYNGNYITSDRAWYALLNYAHKNSLEVSGLPLETFLNNPNMGGEPKNWTAEIYMPLKNENENAF